MSATFSTDTLARPQAPWALRLVPPFPAVAQRILAMVSQEDVSAWSWRSQSNQHALGSDEGSSLGVLGLPLGDSPASCLTTAGVLC